MKARIELLYDPLKAPFDHRATSRLETVLYSIREALTPCGIDATEVCLYKGGTMYYAIANLNDKQLARACKGPTPEERIVDAGKWFAILDIPLKIKQAFIISADQ
jgi:hypothetical protein